MLTQSEIDIFNEQGFLVVEDVIDLLTLQTVQAEYAELLEKLCLSWTSDGGLAALPEGADFWGKLDHCYKAGFDWFQPMDISLPHENIREDTPMHFGPAVFDLITHPGILDRVESLIGPELTSNPIQHVRIKPPQRELSTDEIRAHITSTAWHQDRGVGHAEADQTEIVTVWIAVTDATPENGCLQVIPGKWREMFPHCPKKQTTIADGFVDPTQSTSAPVRAGGIVLMHPLTPHSSLPNVSNGYRWSFDVRYNVTGQPTGRSHFPDFVARSRSNPASELRDWRRWRESWEKARAHLAHVPHIPQHRWEPGAPHCA